MTSLAAVPDRVGIASDTTTVPGVGRETPLDADAAVTALYMAHYRSLVRLATLLVDDLGSAEEIVQDAYVKMHGAWRRIREPQAAVGYLRTTVLNLARSRLRHRQVVRRHLQPALPDEPSAEYGALARLEHDRVVAALRTLPTRQRECLVLRYYGDLSEAQIAEVMEISTGAVKSHASRGMAALRATLEAAP